MAPDVLIHGDTLRSAALRHELPLGIIDPFSYFDVGGRRVAVVSSMEAGRLVEVAPEVEVIDPYELGLDELVERGMRWDELEGELCLRAAQRLGARRLVVPGELPVAVADRLRAAGLEVVPDEREFIRRRRSKNAAELAGVRRAQAAANAGMAAAAELLRAGGSPTAESVRARIREVCAGHGCPAPEDIIVAAGPAGASGHETGTGVLPEGVPVIVDIWPRDESSGCFADMTRTFVAGGGVAEDVLAWHALCCDALRFSERNSTCASPSARVRSSISSTNRASRPVGLAALSPCSKPLRPPARKCSFHLPIDVSETPWRRAASAWVLSPDKTDSTIASLTSTGCFGGRATAVLLTIGETRAATRAGTHPSPEDSTNECAKNYDAGHKPSRLSQHKPSFHTSPPRPRERLGAPGR